MSCFDEEPVREGYPCECGGSITKNDRDVWECDGCDFQAESKVEDDHFVDVNKVGTEL